MVPTMFHSFRSQVTVPKLLYKALIVVACLINAIALFTNLEKIFEWEGKGRKLFGKSEKKQETNIHHKRDDVSDLTGVTDEFSFNLLFDHNRSQCGGKKCFLRLKEDADSLYNNTGYLIRHDSSIDRFQRTWDLAKKLENDYNVSTLVIAHPPQILPINKTFTQNLMLEYGKRRRQGKKYAFSLDKALIVQRVKVAPEPNIIWQEVYDHVRIRSYPFILKHLTEFVELNVKGREMFCHNLFSSLNITREFLANPKYECLHYDFQMIMDYDGIFHHIDLDRCFEIDPEYREEFHKKVKHFLDYFALAFRRTFQSMNVSCSLMNEK